MSDYKIYALRGPSFREDPEGYRNWTSLISMSLQDGVGRFGWSNVETADLRQLEKRITERGWDDLNDKEQDFIKHSYSISKSAIMWFTSTCQSG